MAFMRKAQITLLSIITVLTIAGCSSNHVPSVQSSSDTLRIGTYNVQNLFDSVDDPHKADDPQPSAERLSMLAEVITSVDCDILALQEVENIEILRAFNEYYLQNRYMEVVLVEGNDPRGIDVAVMSKFPLDNVISYREREIPDVGGDGYIRFSRDLLAVQWSDPDGNTWSLLTTHLKSGTAPEDRLRRTAQAREIARICRSDSYISLMGHGNLILAGDLNAEPWSGDLGALSGVPFSDPARDLPYRSTHASRKVLDYILLSPSADRRYIIGSYTIYKEYPSEDASDHFLLYLDLEY